MTIKIKVTGHSKFKAVMGERIPLVLEMEEGTLRDALETLSRNHGKTVEDMLFDPRTRGVKRSNVILLNGQPYLNLRDRLRSDLADGDEINILPALVGG
jgi:hypothetical protein